MAPRRPCIPCSSCGKPHDKRHKLCWSCYVTSVQSPDRPPYKYLRLLLAQHPCVYVARAYGVSNNTIKRWVQNYQEEIVQPIEIAEAYETHLQQIYWDDELKNAIPIIQKQGANYMVWRDGQLCQVHPNTTIYCVKED